MLNRVKGMFNRKGGKGRKGKEPESLIQLMQIDESVSSASLDVVTELKDSEGTAIRELPHGLLIVAFTNEGLLETGITARDEEFGSFSESLRSETIESIALRADLDRDVVGIIPSRETLIALSEYNFIQDLIFHWAVLPYNVNDDSELEVYTEQDVMIGDLLDVASNPSITFELKNGEIAETIAMDGVSDMGSDDLFDESDDLFADIEPVDDTVLEEEDIVLDETYDDFDTDVEDDIMLSDIPMDDFDESMDTVDYDDTLGVDDSFDESVFDDVGDMFDVSVDGDMTFEEESQIADEVEVETKRLAEHVFQNDELELSVNMALFDDYFDNDDVAQFEISNSKDGKLDEVLDKLRQDANTELKRFRQHNVEDLRNQYASSMRDIHIKLTEALDYESDNTVYGEKHRVIQSEHDRDIRDIDRKVAGQREELEHEYKERREEYGEQAKIEAFNRYDVRYRDELESNVRQLRDDVRSDIVTGRDIRVAKLFDDRRATGKRLYDKATATLLRDIQTTFQDVARRELEMYDAFRKDMDAYLRRHFADEVLRSKAEAEKMRQSHEAETVRNQYEQLLQVRSDELDQMERTSRDNIRKMEEAHREQIKELHGDYAHTIKRSEKDSENLRSLLSEANESISKINEQKDKEVVHRISMYEDAIEAKDKEIEYANERANRTQKPFMFIAGAVAVVFLALGIMFGFMFSANQTYQIAPGATDVQDAQYGVTYDEVMSHQDSLSIITDVDVDETVSNYTSVFSYDIDELTN